MAIPASPPRKIIRPSAQQRAASDPRASAWVSANAGSGKTSVLVDRVVRLMRAGAGPNRILCLTYTKAAAANMQNRVFDRLGSWAALADAELSDELEALDGERPGPLELLEARRLFARAVETPGGLKIQTIHAFCERLLHLFPFEAAAPARFEMLDEAQTAAALARALEATLRAALSEPEAALGAALRSATEAAGEDGLREAIRAFITHRKEHGRDRDERKFAASPLRQALGLAAGENPETIAADMLAKGPSTGDMEALIEWLASGSKTDGDQADRLRKALKDEDGDAYRSAFLTGDGSPRKKLVTEKLVKARPELVVLLMEEQDRIVKLAGKLLAARAAERTEAVTLLADSVLGRYEAEKRRLGRLDFDDLIRKARDLLISNQARWVLYKLDQGMDHILVDEAQDTSPAQWDIVKALADEFFEGEDAGRTRSIFAVGDEKQSIFSFQGARPESFAAARRHFDGRIAARSTATADGRGLLTVPLLTSYRTTPDVLQVVDQVFRLPENHAGLTSGNAPTEHEPVRKGEPGLVELWPPEEKQPEPEEDPMAPVDALPPNSPEKALALRIAGRIRFWLDKRIPLEATGKAIDAGDILVLVRSRNAIFDETIKALKALRIPAAGADRMKLGRQIAVKDLLSLGRFCILPEDDLSLAEVLKSPLIGFDDKELEIVSAGRGAMRLLDRLAELSGKDAAVAEALRRIEAWRALAATSDPLAFYSRVLSAEGRARLIGRLGPDAADAIDVFLYRLRRWQAANPASLPLFIDAMSGDETDVKRDMEDAHGRVRVMTIHASKGLEAPIVFLADTHHKPGGRKGPKLFEAVVGYPATAVWCPRKKDDPAAVADSRARHAALEAAEHRRLLYVGLTRARDRLYICGAARKPDPEHWRSMIDAALAGHERLQAVQAEEGSGNVLQWRTPYTAPVEAKTAAGPAPRPNAFPWLRTAALAEPPRLPPLRPSRIAEAADGVPSSIRSDGRTAARLRGELVHLLLQRLPAVPPQQRAAAASALAEARGGGLAPDVQSAAAADALALMADPRWSRLFDGAARAEVAVAGRIRVGSLERDVSGRIDRLLIAPERITILDYKTGRPPERLTDAPAGVLRQMAAYRELALSLYPGRAVEAAILWTAVPAVAILDPKRLDEALAELA